MAYRNTSDSKTGSANDYKPKIVRKKVELSDGTVIKFPVKVYRDLGQQILRDKK